MAPKAGLHSCSVEYFSVKWAPGETQAAPGRIDLHTPTSPLVVFVAARLSSHLAPSRRKSLSSACQSSRRHLRAASLVGVGPANLEALPIGTSAAHQRRAGPPQVPVPSISVCAVFPLWMVDRSKCRAEARTHSGLKGWIGFSAMEVFGAFGRTRCF